MLDSGSKPPAPAPAPAPAAGAPAPGLFGILALANFVVGCSAIVVVGMLSQLTVQFGVDKAEAGWLMTAYALLYAVSSPVLVSLSGRRDRAHVLMGGLSLLAGALVLAAAAPTFGVLVASRCLMAVGCGLITPVTTAIVVGTVAPAARGKALAVVFGGLTAAQALGVPAGAVIAQQIHWRAAFGALAALSAIVALVLFRRAPRGLQVAPTSLSTLRAVLTTPALVAAISFVLFFFAGIMAVFTYIAPLLDERLGVRGHGLTAILLVFGVGAIAGNALGGRLTDRLGSLRTLLLLGACELVILPLLTLTSLPLLGYVPLVLAWSLVTWAIHVPQQARLSALDPARAPVLLSLHAAFLYVGFSFGAWAGGRVLVAGGYDALGPAGAVAVALALLTLPLTAALTSRR